MEGTLILSCEIFLIRLQFRRYRINFEKKKLYSKKFED